MTKRCSKCCIEKDLEEFHKTSREYQGHTYYYRHSICKECRNAEKRKYNLEHKEEIDAKNRERYRKNKEKYAAIDRNTGKGLTNE